jgi:hypothetical protein
VTALLFVGHPGHELRVHRWLEVMQPEVHVLTDGSGGAGRSRIPSTLRLLAATGARPGSVMGRFTDREAYEVVLERRVSALVPLVHELALAIAGSGAGVVAGDAIEGFNPIHDLCRILLERAVSLAAAWTGRPAWNLEFALDGAHGPPVPSGWHAELDQDALRRKLAAAASYTELHGEIEQVRQRLGRRAFTVECLRPPTLDAPLARRVPDPPYYETYGEQRVAEGHYDRVLRLREHFLPLAEELIALTQVADVSRRAAL